MSCVVVLHLLYPSRQVAFPLMKRVYAGSIPPILRIEQPDARYLLEATE